MTIAVSDVPALDTLLVARGLGHSGSQVGEGEGAKGSSDEGRNTERWQHMAEPDRNWDKDQGIGVPSPLLRINVILACFLAILDLGLGKVSHEGKV